MRLSQEAIQRMISGRSGGGAGGGGSLDPSMLAGMATQAWVEDGYISKAFWAELFIIHKKVTTVVMDGTTEVSRTVDTSGVFTPNEIPETTSETDEETGYVTTVTTEINHIEFRKGAWSNSFISALGLNPSGGGGGLTLNEPLATINVSGLANHPSSSGQTIVWNGTAWVYGTAGGGTGTVTGVKVGDITYSPVNGIVSIPAYPTSMAWSAITGKPTTLAGYGITDAKIDNGVITLGSNTITPLTSSDITDMATKTWVGQQGFALASNVYSKTDADAKFMTIAAFENLFNALNSSDQKVNHPYSSGVASIKAMVGLWTEQYLSALGKNDSGGETVLNEPLASINDAGLAAHPSSSGQTIVWNGTAWVYGTAGGSGMTYTFATGDANGQFKVTPSSGAAYNVSIKGLAALAYKASLAVSDIPDLSGRYLPLTGGTLSISGIGGFTIKNMASNYPLIRFEGNTGGGLGFLGIGKTGDTINPYYVTADSNGGYTDGVSQWNILLHSGNYTDYTYSKNYIDTELAKKLDVAFFDALFQAYAGSTKVTPNASTSSVDNIKAMFGFWTQQYISALGKNDSQGVVSALSDLSDVTITSPSNGQALIYDGGIWKNGAAGMNMTELTTYLSSKILTVKNGTATLGTWNPTAAGTIDIASALGAYLPLTGGTLSINGIGGFTVKNTSSNYPLIRFEGNTGGGLGFIGVGKTGNVIEPYFVTADTNGGYTDGISQWYRIWDSGNDSALFSSFVNSGDNVSLTVGSTTKTLTVGYSTRALRLKNIVMAAGDDYDTLSGYTADRGSFVAVNINSIPSSSMTLSGMDNNWATLLSFGYNNRTIQFMGFGWSDTLKYRHVYTISGTNYGLSPWKTIAFTDGNVASATRLAGTATKSAWGQTYWSNGQPQDVSGDIEYTGNITPSASNVSNVGTRNNYYNGVYCGYFNLIDSTTNEDFNIAWYNVDGNRVLAMYCWETIASDIIIGTTSSSYGLYFDGTRGRWGIGTSVPGRRFSSENVGLKLDVAGIARANQLQAYNSAGETMLLNSTTSYDCIVFQINSASKWSVGADNSNNFYWYTQPGGNRTVMYLTSAGVLNVSNSVKCTDLWIGNIHITYDSTNGGIHIANGGLSVNTYVSALGVGQEGGGTQGLDIEAMWTELATPNSARQIDSSHISNALSNYVTTNTLSGYATQQWVNSQGFASASSLSNYVSAVSTSSGKLNVTKGGSTTSTDIIALRLGQSTLGDSASLATFTHSTDLIYTAKGGSNTCSDKPTGVDSFGLIAMKTAGGYYGQMLMTSGGEVYTRSSNSLSGGWRKQLDSLNWSGVVTLSALGGASVVALSEATTRISTLEGYFNTGGVAKKAAVLNTARTINGTNFDGSASITTRSWGTARTITLADHDSSNTHANNGIDGSENITLYLPSTIKATLNGNASSATTATTASKLSTVSKTAWGQTYWTSGGVPADVSGSIDAGGNGGQITGFHSIELNNYGTLSGYGGFIDFHYNGSSANYTARLIETNYGLVKLQSKGANGNDQRAALVVGEGYTSSYIQIGDIRLVCDSNHDLRVVMASGAAANLYATGGISALGMSAGTSSIDEMTFGYLNVNNELNFGSAAKIYMDDFFYIDSDAHVSVNGVEFENSNAHANKLYLGNSQYLYVSGGTLYYYNGSSSKVITS